MLSFNSFINISSSGSSALFQFGCVNYMFLKCPSKFLTYIRNTISANFSPASPVSVVLQCFQYFFEPAKKHWVGRRAEKKTPIQCFCLRLQVFIRIEDD